MIMAEHLHDADIVSDEEWSVIHAIRRLGQPVAQSTEGDSPNGLEGAYRRLEGEILDNIGATLDRMIDRADRTSGDLDVLLQRLSETTGLQRPAA